MEPLSAALEVASAHEDVQTRATVTGMLRAYDSHWPKDRYKVLEVEAFRVAPMPTLGGKSRKRRNVSLAGKIDLLAIDRQTGNRVLIDHKTTSEQIAEPDASYWRHLQVDTQSTHYALLEFLYGNQVDEILWDVARKPGIRIKQKETPEEYVARLQADMQAEPASYLQRRTVPRLREDMAEYLTQLDGEISEMKRGIASEYHPKNHLSCFNYHTPCRYLGICSGYDTPDSDKWTRQEWKHPELPALVTKDQIITNSRMNTFRECRRKHHFQHGLGLRRVDEKPSAALGFGDVWHRSLEAYFNSIKGQN